MVEQVEGGDVESPGYLCLFHLATAGQQGPNLGADEEEIVALVYVLLNRATQKVAGVQQYVVKPTIADTSDSFLSPEVLQCNPSLTPDLVRKGLPLDVVITQFDSYLKSLKIAPDQLILVTDGELPLRQALHPEACYKKIDLPDYYNAFCDLRKDLKAFYSATEDMRSVQEMLDYLSMQPQVDPEFCLRDVSDLLIIVKRLLADGHKFKNTETIMIHLEPGLCSKDEEVDPHCVVRARGLPWQSSDGDIAKFFRGLNIAKGGVALCLSSMGRRNGEALVRFVNQTHRDLALRRHKHHMGQRYIEVYKSTGEEFVAVAGGSSTEAHDFLSRGGQVIVRMRGLPYDCTADKVIEFFRTGINRCEVLDGEDGVLFVKKADGRATGDAFVLFANESDAPVALSKHRELIGSRYIELFRSTSAEVQQVLNRTTQDVKTTTATPAAAVNAAAAAASLPATPLLPTLPPAALLPQHVITCGTARDCIRLRGLPYEAQVEHILEFLGDFAKNIVYQGVHMVYNSQGQPSGEAFIQMDSEQAAYLAATQRHHQTMLFGKKHRYVEVFQCSGDEMNTILNGGQLSPKPVLGAGGSLVPGPFAVLGGLSGALPPAPRGAPQYPVYIWSYPSPPVSPTGYYPPPPPTHPHLALFPSEWTLDYMGGAATIPPLINTQPMNVSGVHSVLA